MHCSAPGRLHQQGSVLVQFALFLGVLLTVLAVVDIGYVYLAKRELQRNADLAALHAVQFIDFSADTANERAQPCEQAGAQSIQANEGHFNAITLISRQVTCGEWNPEQFTGPAHFSSASAEINAAQVTMTGRSPTFFPVPLNRVVSATAIAKRGAPLAVFSVGSKLAAVGCAQQLAPLIQLLQIVGTGEPCVTVNSYEGLAGATISASGLLAALGLPLDANLSVADVNDLLAARKVSLGKVLDVAATLVGHDELLAVNAQLLSVLGARLGIDALNLEIPLGSGPNGPGIFAAIDAPAATKASALDVQVDVLELITAAVGVGTTGRGVAVPGVGIQVPRILPNLLQVRAGITEPPSIAIGGVGATAYNAQIRLYINVDTTGGALGGLLQLLGTQVKLPIYIDITRAKATLEELSCKAPVRESTARIRMESSIAQVCVGKVTGDPFSIRTPICESIEDETLISALGLLRIKNRIKIDALEHEALSDPMKVGEIWTTGNQLNLGTTLSGVVNEILRLLGDLLGAPISNGIAAATSSSVNQLASYYLGNSTNSSENHPDGPLPRRKLVAPLLGQNTPGPSGVYDVDKLAERLKKDIDRTKKYSFLSLIHWERNYWDDWANIVDSAIVTIPQRACKNMAHIPEGYVYSGAAGTPEDVSRFNRCVERELKEALIEVPDEQPNFLQVMLGPLMDLLKDLLDPLGDLLADDLLRKALGIELGLTDVHLRSVGCGNGSLVY